MLDIGFSEILLIFVLGLIVLGPEKLPRVAAQLGRWIGRARSMARQFREQLEEEITVEETKKKSAKPASANTTGESGDGGSTGGGGGAGVGGTEAVGGAGGESVGSTGNPQSPTSESEASGGGGTTGGGTPNHSQHSASSEAPHLDLTNEPWPYVTPPPPPEVSDIFHDVLKTPVPGAATAESTAGASERAAASGATRVPPPEPAPKAEVYWPHDHEIPEATPEKVSEEAPLSTHERGP